MDNNDIKVSQKMTVASWLLTGVVFLVLFFVFCVRFIGAGEVGIITRFGEVDRVAKSGMAIKAPWPFERLTKMEIRVQKEEQASQAATTDLQDVSATLALNYALDTGSALNVYKTLGTDYKERVITPTLQESFKSATANYTAEQLVTERPAVKGKAYDIIKQRLQKYGIRVVDLNITNFKYSDQFNAAIESVQVANQNIAKARQELETTKIEAEKAITAAQGQAEAQRLQQQTLTPLMVQKQAIEKWNGVLPTTTASDGTIFSIPLR